MTVDALLVDDPSLQPPPEPIPTFIEKRGWYMLRLLAQTMIGGGFLTKGLYVPRYVWVQGGVKLFALDVKMASLESLHSCLIKSRGIDLHTEDSLSMLMEELEEFENVMESVRMGLSKKLKFIDETLSDKSSSRGDLSTISTPLPGSRRESEWSRKDSDKSTTTSTTIKDGSFSNTTVTSVIHALASSTSPSTSSPPINTGLSNPSSSSTSKLSSWGTKISKSMEKLGKKTTGVGLAGEDISPYVDLLIKVFNAAQIQEQWLNYAEENNEPMVGARLRRIGVFWATVICPFVVRDLEVLIEKFMKKMRQSITM